MTKPTVIRWKGVALGLYFMGDGDKIPMHKHDWTHTICLLCGEGEFEIVGDGITKMEITENYVLPADIEHEIRATAVNTIMVGMMDDISPAASQKPPQYAGVLLHDGTIATHDDKIT